VARIERSTALALATGAASVVPLWRAPRAVRAAVVAGAGIAAGAATFVGARVPEAFGGSHDPVPVRPAAAVAVAAGGLMAAATVAGIALDRSGERLLVRRGVRHPRLVLGVAGAALSWLADAAERRGA